MKPDARNHNPAPGYIRSLVESADLTQREAARAIGITDRMVRYYLSDKPESYRPCPYPEQFALECLVPGPTLQDWLDTLSSDQRANLTLAEVWEAAREWRKP